MATEHPAPIKPRPGTMPAALTERRQWCVWRLETNAKGESTKVPYRADKPGMHASSTNPDTWTDYETARQCVEAGKADGPGFVFADDDGLVFVDLDDVIDDHGGIDPARRWIVDAMRTHWHLSQSGQGLHAVAYGAIPAAVKNKAAGVEMYAAGRYMAIPAQLQVLEDVTEVTDCGPVLEAIYERYRLDKVEPGTERAAADPVRMTMAATEVTERLKERPNMAALIAGDAFAYDGYSEARYALANGAAFYTDDVAIITEIVRNSGLYKPGESDQQKDRRAAYDAKRALEGYTGPRYDPEYGKVTTGSVTLGDRSPLQGATRPDTALDGPIGGTDTPNGETEPTGDPTAWLHPAGSDEVMEPVAAGILERRDFYQKTGRKFRGYATGFDTLDSMLGGLEPARVTLLQAEPGAGKTLISNQIAYTLAANGAPVLYVTLENEHADLIRKHVARIADVSPSLLDRGQLDIAESGVGPALDTFQETAQSLYYLEGSSETRKEHVTGALAYMADRHPDSPPVLCLDYLQAFARFAGGTDREDMFTRIGNTSQMLIDIAKTYRAHVWAITSLNRDAYRSGNTKTGMAGAKGSGDLEYDAGAVITLVKGDAHAAPSSHVDVLNMHVVKNRFGPTGQITLHKQTRSLAVGEAPGGTVHGAVKGGSILAAAQADWKR